MSSAVAATVAPASSGSDGVNRYTVAEHLGEQGWSVAIVSPGGAEVAVRACRDEHEARTYASTVRQHIAWLSEPTFREYYRLEQGARGAQGASADASTDARAVAPREQEA